MSAHTPGPWQFGEILTASENHKGFRIYGADDRAFASILPIDQDGNEGEANARLIAAAPEMASELKNACFRLSEMQYEIIRGGQPNNTPEVQRQIDAIDAVLAKALGQEVTG